MHGNDHEGSGRGVVAPSTVRPTMTAPNDSRAVGIESDDAPTAEPSTTTFDARDRLLGRLDDMAVRHAAEDTGPTRSNPTPRGGETVAEVGQ